MHLRIVTDDGVTVGEIDTTQGQRWRDLLVYISGRWDDESEAVAFLALKVSRLPEACK